MGGDVSSDQQASADGEWDLTADVVVVGYGAAGAALEATDAGAQVLVLERFAGGGASALSGDVIYAGGGASVQHEVSGLSLADCVFSGRRAGRFAAGAEVGSRAALPEATIVEGN
ncbi:hypothetical protein ACW2Q0_11830 [Nocardia sp. R16R-3T]